MIQQRFQLNPKVTRLLFMAESIAAMFFCGCSSDNTATGSIAESALTTPLVPPQQREFLISAPPNAACSVDGVTLASDENGLIHLWMDGNSTGGPAEGQTSTMACTDGSGIVTTSILNSDALVASQPSLQRIETNALSGHPRAPLVGDPMAYRQEDLVAMGYPPRPDPTPAPAAYARWLARSAAGLTVRDPHPVAIPGVTRTPVQRYDVQHSGMDIAASGTTKYLDVSATWVVPAITARHHSGNITSAMWVGLDGLVGFPGASNLAQGGTDSDEVVIIGVSMESYYAWTEFVPGPFHKQTSLPISAGDSVDVEEWIGDINGNPTLTGTFGWTYIQDDTQATAMTFKESLPSGQTYAGGSALWNLERGTTNGVIDRLAQYTFAEMKYTQAFESNWAEHDYLSDTAYLVWMRNPPGSPTGTILTDVSYYTDRFWLDFHWDSPI